MAVTPSFDVVSDRFRIRRKQPLCHASKNKANITVSGGGTNLYKWLLCFIWQISFVICRRYSASCLGARLRGQQLRHKQAEREWARPAMYIQRYAETRSCNLLLQWKSNIYCIFWECVCSRRYPACNALVAYYVVISVLPRSAILFLIISQTARFSIKKCFWI
jgi:hypothetical protein